MGDPRFRVSLPDFAPGDVTAQSHNLREIERWGNMLPIDLPHVLRIGVLPSTTRSTSSATYVDWPVTDVCTGTFKKRYGALTKLEFTLLCTGYAGAGTPVATYGVSLTVNGTATDYDLTKYAFNTALDHRTIVGALTVPGQPAGKYTITLRAKISANSLTADANDYHQLVVSEVMDLSEA